MLAESVTDVATVAAAVRAIRAVYVAPVINDYIVSIVDATRHHPELRLGASPRASLHLMRASRAAAALAGRDYVIPEDVSALAGIVLAHRILPTVEAQVARRDPASIIASAPLPNRSTTMNAIATCARRSPASTRPMSPSSTTATSRPTIPRR